MGRLRVQLAVSADGFIAPADGSLAWLEPFPAGELGFDSFLASIGSVVMGRTSYEEMQRLGPSPFDAIPTLVVTSRALAGARPSVQAVPVDQLRAALSPWRQQPKDTWLFGGARTIAACLDADLVDSFELAVIPGLLGDGTLLFSRRKPGLASLRLVEARRMKKDVLWLEYSCR